MIAALLRAMHVPVWVVFAVFFGGYTVMVIWTLINGYTRELTGWKHAGRPSKMHKVFYKWHTGLVVSLTKTAGDERHLKRTAGGTNRATPEGMIILFHSWKRWQRAIRNNVITVLALLWSCGMALDPAVTLQSATIALFVASIGMVALGVRRLRHKHAQGPQTSATLKRIGQAVSNLPVPIRATRTAEGKTISATDTFRILDSSPRLSSEVPISIMASLLSDTLGTSPAEVDRLLNQSSDRGSLRLPDRFPALQKQRDVIEEIIRSHQRGDIRFSWLVTRNPRILEWVPVVIGVLPDKAIFRDWLPEISKAKKGQQAAGITAEGQVYMTDHRGELPWHCRCASPGSGKSTAYMVKGAQILRNDPKAQLYGVDTKQVSFEPLKGLPRVHIFDDPESRMGDIWDVFYDLESLMRKRYSAVRRGEAKPEEFDDIWLLVDEGNDLATMIKLYYNKMVKPTMDNAPAAPPIWAEAIASLINLGRQVGIRGEFMFQNLTDRALGGVSLRDSFAVYGMAGFTRNQFTRIIGTSPAPDCKEGAGKILMCQGPRRTWVQGFYDDPKWLRAYAMAGAKGETA